MKMKKLWNNKNFWEAIGYVSLALCIFGQVAVGYVYMVAQVAYLIANTWAVIRSFKLDQPRADKVRNIVFLAITVALIVIKIFGKTS